MQENFNLTPKTAENSEQQSYFTPEQKAEIKNLSAETLNLLEGLYGKRGELVYKLEKEREMLQNAKENINLMINNKSSEALDKTLSNLRDIIIGCNSRIQNLTTQLAEIDLTLKQAR